ncbi:MAG TPA: MFS transporter [Ohtaekwangia sp.]|nr:MFS transporter [Ohtaekwangia sp.]
MSSIAIDQQETFIRWKQMWSLTALYASIIIGWIAYQQYQPKLLVQFKFTEFTFLIIVSQAIILSITPLIAGKLGDRYRFKSGTRLPIISSGISFAAMVFMAVAFTLLGNPGEIFKWILPVLIILWLIAMSIFTSPALSTIETFFPVDKLPKAMAVLTITANLLYALEPVIIDVIDFLGAPVTFITGGVLVFLSGYSMKKNAMSLFSKNNGREDAAPDSPIVFNSTRSSYGYIFILGVVLGLATTFLFNLFPEVLQLKLSGMLQHYSSKIVLVGILVVSGILALPFSNVVNLYGMKRSFWFGAAITALSTAGIFGFNSSVVVLVMLIIFSIGFSVLSVSSLPLAIVKSNFDEKVFCVGIFFSGVAVPDGVVEILLY